ncbi:phage portal protein [Nitrosomonas sp. Nm34]|uniref:phage portal protein n=1 Tax=Nitrosomonas sp. Nm34 TaxID=1881055 RepID=UPI0008E31B94|nr:phage portal protein [Nitrosomonas sp. Nm34]SFI31299.1 phage portal protein, lambda family [Nitrosomonas sp. Nm34]
MKNLPKMNFLDRAIAVIAPGTALNRIRNRTALALSGSYTGGSRSRASMRNWNPYAGDANSDIIYDLEILRARSRDLARNAPIGGAAINSVVTNVIGTGLSMQSNPDTRFLGMTDEQANEFKREVEAEWSIWCSSTECDVSRNMNFYGLQGLALRSMLESGDVLVLTPAIAKKNNPYRLAIQLIESDRISNKGYAADTDTKFAGVTLDSNGAAIKYDIAKKHPGSLLRGGNEWIEVDAFGQDGRINAIHLLDKTRPGQVRGVPFLAPVIEQLKQLSRYAEAELQAAVVSAALAIFVKMDTDAFESLFQEDAKQSYIKNAAGWDGSLNFTMDDSGKVINLLPGEDVLSPDLGRPNANFDPFFLAMLKQIGPVLEIPFEVLTKHFSASYSASRAALLDFWRIVRRRRDFMATYFCEPIKELWFEEAVSSGRIAAPGFFADIRIRQAYTRVTWVGDGPGSIDPLKEVSAAEKRIAVGISTREKETASYDGGDYESNIEQLGKEKKLMEAAGLSTESKAVDTGSLVTSPEQT